MFSDFDRKFMAEKMKIVVESIELKLNDPFFAEIKEIAVDSISKYIEAIAKFNAYGVSGDICFGQDNKAEEFINAHFCKIAGGVKEGEQYQVLDALRYSFSCYAGGGLHQLYSRQENESWHPKVYLTEILEPNDIEPLPQNLILYRGCDISEIAEKSFGQAWSTSVEVARKFAYTHYQDQEWFDVGSRGVLKATCSKEHVLFSDQSIEFEVVVNVEKLNFVYRHL